MSQPWLVDFDLKRMHPLCCNFGMGAPYMFYGEEKNSKIRKEDPQAWMDRFTAATLAFVNALQKIPYKCAGKDDADRKPLNLTAEVPAK